MKLRIAHYITATTLLTALGCGGSNPEPETPGEKVGEAVEEAGEEIEETGDNIEEDSE
jgi:hypothetical protein